MDFDFTTETIIPENAPDLFISFGGVQCIEIPAAITANRPTSPAQGMIRFNTSLTALEWYNGTSWIQESGGTVTSVALAAPAFLTVSGSPVTTSGTLTLTLATQTANTVFAGPTTGAAAAPTFRALVAADLTGLVIASFSAGTTGLTPNTATTGAVTLAGTLVVGNGGTGVTTTPTNGQLLIGNGTNYTVASVGSGTGISTTVGAGTLQINNTGVTSNVATANQTTVSAATGAVTIGLASALIAPGSVQVTTSLQTSATNTITAAGATQGTATALTTDYNIVTTAAAGTGVVLPAGLAGRRITVINRGANAVLVYPASGGTIDALASNAAFSVAANGTYEVEAITATQWYSVAGSAENTGVTTFSAGTTGFTPSSATSGAITLAGTLVVGNGGTGVTTTPTNGQLLIGNGTNYTVASVGSGTGISTTVGAGTLTINNTGVTSNVATANQTTVSAATGAVTIGLSSTLVAPGSLQITTSLQTSATNTITAAGATQGTATALTTDYNVVTTTGAGQGVILPAGLAGHKITVVNRGANALLVYPAVGGTIDGLAANAAFSVPVNGTYEVEAITATQWYSIAGSAVSSGVSTFSAGTTGFTPSSATAGAVTLAGTLVPGNGGTGVTTTPTNGQILVGNGTNYTVATVGTGTGISTTVGAGTLTINNTGVTSIAGTANQIAASAATGAVTLSITNPFIAPGVVEVTNGLMYNSVSAAVSAAGTTQGTGTALTAQYNVITTAAAGTGVVLPTPTVASTSITITNKGANALLVYPASGGTIDALAANIPVTLPIGASATYSASSTTQWYTTDPVLVAGTNITISYGAGQTTVGTVPYMSSSVVVPSTLVSGTTYSSTVTTNLGTQNIVASVYNNSTLQLVTPNAVLVTGPNGLTLQATGNSNAYLVAVATGTIEFTVTPATLVSGTTHSSTITHNLGTNNYVVCVYNNSTGALIVGASVQQTNVNTLVLQVTGNTTTYRVVLALGTQFQVTPATLVSGTTYQSTITHNLGTNNLVVCVYNNATGQLVTPLSIQQTTTNALVLQVTGNTTTYNVIIVNGTVVSTSASTSGAIIKSFTFYASALDNPNSADWAVSSVAPAIADPSFQSMSVRQFSTASESGVGTFITVPSNATNVSISFKGRAQVAPGAASTIIPYFYVRSIPNNAAVGAWSSHFALTAQTVPTNANYQYYTQATTALATYNMAAGNLYLLQFDISTTGTYTTSNWLMAELTIAFS